MKDRMPKEIPLYVRLIVASIFLLLEGFLFYLIVFLKINNIKYYCYLSIVLCFIISSIFVVTSKYNYIILTALLFTLFADLFFVLIQQNNYYIFGIILINIVQLIYLFYVTKQLTKKLIFLTLLIRIISSMVFVFIALCFLKPSIKVLTILSIISFVNLLMNIIISGMRFKSDALLFFGLILLMLSFVVVVLKQISEINQFISQWNFNMVWFFYLPSQILISLFPVFKKFIRKEQDNVSKEIPRSS